MVHRPVVERWVDHGVVSLDEIVVHSVDDDFPEAKVFISVHTMLVRRAWLVDGPVVEWWVDDWVVKLKKVVVYSINDDVLHSEIFVTLHSMLMWN